VFHATKTTATNYRLYNNYNAYTCVSYLYYYWYVLLLTYKYLCKCWQNDHKVLFVFLFTLPWQQELFMGRSSWLKWKLKV